MKNYYVKTSEIENKPGQWNSTLVEIFSDEDKIGEYRRNYPNFAETTFVPFTQNGQDYALYSKDYTCTRIMKLPSCEDIGGEDPNAMGFCPVEYFVPISSWTEEDLANCKKTFESKGLTFDIRVLNGQFGFVAGCHWGDDASWKIQFLDLSRVSEGILIRDERFGYIELPAKLSLKDAIDTEMYEEGFNFISITHATIFDITKESCQKD